jgi:hypothetical protein
LDAPRRTSRNPTVFSKKRAGATSRRPVSQSRSDFGSGGGGIGRLGIIFSTCVPLSEERTTQESCGFFLQPRSHAGGWIEITMMIPPGCRRNSFSMLFWARMPKRPRKLSRDPNARAYEIVRIATGEAQPEPEPAKNPAAVALGKLGGAKGGRARAARMTPRQRSLAAKKAAKARWSGRAKS